MPEGPEAEICRRQLDRWWSGRRVLDVRLFDVGCIRTKRSTSPQHALPDALQWLRTFVVGKEWLGSERVGKRIGIRLESLSVLLHLGMTGRWIRSDRPDHRFCRLAVQIEPLQWLCFLDVRRFGGLVPVEGDLIQELQKDLGPDAMDTVWTGAELQQCVRGRRPIKVALMDQKNIAGIGNIHATEALWKCGIHPLRTCVSLSHAEWESLASVIPEHLKGVVRRDDTDEMIYVTQGGRNLFSVYGRKGGICPRCNGTISIEKIQGRTSFLCVNCQLF